MKRSRSFPKTRTMLVALAGWILAWIPATPSAAQELTTRLGMSAQVGGCLPALDDVNRQIGAGNEFLANQGWKQIDKVNLAFNFVGDLRGRIGGPIWASIGGGHVFGRTGIDFDEVVTIKPSASFYHLRLLYELPFRPRPRMLLRLGAGPTYASNGRLTVEHEARRVEGGTQRIEKVEFKAKGWGAHGFVEAEYMLTSRTTLVVDLGYRQLKLNEDSFSWKISEILLPNSDEDGDGVPNKFDLNEDTGIIGNAFLEVLKEQDGSPQIINAAGEPRVIGRGIDSIDFSGALLNVGLRVYLF